MASYSAERGGNAASKAVDQVKNMAANAAKSASDALDDQRKRAADAIDDAADTVGEKGKGAPEPAKRYSHTATATDTLHDAADYVRHNDASERGRDAMHVATAHPVASLFVLGAVVVGGSLLVAAMMRDDGPASSSGESRRPTGLASAASGLGPKGTETLTRIRDAAFSFVLAKTVDTVEEIFPGFREHYERR